MRLVYHQRTMGDGAEGIHIKEMVQAFREIGHDVRVVSLVGETAAGTNSRGRSWAAIQRAIPAAAYEVAELAYNIVSTRSVARAIAEFRPDFVYDRYNSYSTGALKAARQARLPLLLEVNAPVAYERIAYEHLPLKFPRLAQSYERYICSSADHVFAVSTPLKRHLTERHGVQDACVTVLPNGANPDRFDPTVDSSVVRARHGLLGSIVVGFVGILRPWHGVEMLLEALAALRASTPALRLLIVGDGPLQNELETRAKTLRVQDHLVFTGRIRHDDVSAYIGAMDVAVSPRATFYASPMKILEYMAMAKAVVAPDMPNIRDIIRHGETGVLFEPDNPNSLQRALQQVVASPEERRQLGQKARDAVVSTLNWHTNARAVCNVAAELTGTNQRSRH
jgi:glycosyltransferase involved in cell wall biosynthesis